MGDRQMVHAAFQGFTAIPASATDGIQVRPKRPWYEVLGVSRDAPPEVIEAAGKAMQRKPTRTQAEMLPTFKKCRRPSERPPRASDKSERPNPQSCCTGRGTALDP
jgi:hypothetical protein